MLVTKRLHFHFLCHSPRSKIHHKATFFAYNAIHFHLKRPKSFTPTFWRTIIYSIEPSFINFYVGRHRESIYIRTQRASRNIARSQSKWKSLLSMGRALFPERRHSAAGRLSKQRHDRWLSWSRVCNLICCIDQHVIIVRPGTDCLHTDALPF